MSNGGNEMQNSLKELNEKLTGTLPELRKQMSEIQKELDIVKNNVETVGKELTKMIAEEKLLEDKIEKFKYIDKIDWKRIPVLAISLGISVIFSYLFLHCDVVVLVSFIFGIVAIVITAVVMLTRRNSED